MAKKADQKAAVLAAAKKGSGTVFEALNDDVATKADRTRKAAPAAASSKKAATSAAPAKKAAPVAAPKPTAAPAAAPQKKETPKMSTQTPKNEVPQMDMNAAADGMRKVFASTGIDAKNFDAKTLVERSQKLAQEAAELARGNVEAMAASARIAAQNAGTLSQDVAELGRKGFESTSEAMKGFAEAKSPSELLRLQSEFAKSYMETMISEGAKLSETMVKLAGEAMEPVSSRFQIAADRAKSLSN